MKIKCEPIKTEYKEKLIEAYNVQIKKGDIKKEDVYNSQNYCDEMAKFIKKDYEQFKRIKEEDEIGAMVVAATSEQARKVHKKRL